MKYSIEEIMEARAALKLGTNIKDEQVDNILEQLDMLADIFLDSVNEKLNQKIAYETKLELLRKGYSKKFINEFLEYISKINQFQLQDLHHEKFEKIFKDYLEILKNLNIDINLTEDDFINIL